MKKNLFKLQFAFSALDRKIITIATISIVLIITAAFIGVVTLTKRAFYKTEREKANIIIQTAIPLLQMEFLLGMESQIDDILEALKKNRDVEAVVIYKNNRPYKAIGNIPQNNNIIKIKKDIIIPNTKRKIAEIVLYYKSTNYHNLYKKYVVWISFIFFLIFTALIFLALYIKNLIKPFRILAIKLKNYTPPQKIDLTDIPHNSEEIEAICKVIENMQKKIVIYSRELESWNAVLEKRVEEKTKQLKKQFYTDSLTQLPNRLALVEKINSEEVHTLVILNIDDFKQVNDYFGHLIGDKVLVVFSDYLKKFVKKRDGLFRVGGDEFALVLKERLDTNSLQKYLEEIYHKVESFVFTYNESNILIRVTIGAANERQNILEKADIALKYAKTKHKHFAIYNKQLEIERLYKENLEWVQRIAKAIEEHRIVPYFQPIVWAKDKKIKGYEALMRMIEDQKVEAPYHFIQIAKKSRFYPVLTQIMFFKCCRYFHGKKCSFSFNLSIEDIENEETVHFLEEIIDKFSMGKQIIFEITETEGIANYDMVMDFIQKMKKRGVQFSLDDFGSGYSNFEYLANLDIDYIKIDGSLIKNILKDQNSLIVVETVVAYAKKRGILSVAEFVSSEAIYEKVKEIGIDLVQGYYIGEPTPDAQC